MNPFRSTLLILFFIFLLSTLSSAQSCLPDGIKFTSQQEIDDFSGNYPNCEKIEGDLTVSGFAISNLAGLSQVTSIGGSLIIEDNVSLVSLAGLNNLKLVEGDLIIDNNNVITSLAGLGELDFIGGSLEILGSSNTELTSLTGLENLDSIGQGLVINFNGDLTALTGLENLKFIGGSLSITSNGDLTSIAAFESLDSINGGVILSGNTILTSLEGLEKLSTLNSLSISDHLSLNSLAGLENLHTIYDRLYFYNNNSLVSLSGLENLKLIGGELKVQSNPHLTSLTGLESLDSIKRNLNILYNTRITSFAGLGNLKFIGEGLSISNNIALKSPAGLNSLKFIRGGVSLVSNDSIVNLSGLDSLNTIEGNILINHNNALTSFEGLEGLNSIDGFAEIRNNPNLISLKGLENLHSIVAGMKFMDNLSLTSLMGLNALNSTQYVTVENNNALISLEGLENLDSIWGNLEIKNNPSLSSLAGLENLNSIGEEIIIDNNQNLTSLTNLESLSSIGSKITISNNTNLSSLSGLESLNSNWWGTVIIAFNDSLRSLEGLESLNLINGIAISNNNALISLAGLENLRVLSTGLSIDNNVVLNSLTALNTLEIVRGGISLRGNNSLASLAGLENVNSVTGTLSIGGHANLTSLSALGRIDDIAWTYVSILNNPLLTFCNEPSICDYFANGGAGNIRNNGSKCSSEVTLLESCENRSKVNYQIFYDLNQNKIKEPEELIYTGANVKLNPEATIHFTNQEEGGLLFLNPGTYEIAYDSTFSPGWKLTTDSASYQISIDTISSCDTLYFGVFPDRIYSAMTTHITSPPTRCNTLIPFEVHLKNLGTTVTSGTLWLEVDEKIKSVQFFDQPDTTVAPDKYGWHFEDLFPGQQITRKIFLEIPGPPDFTLGETLSFISYTDFSDGNSQYQSHIFEYNPEIRCSFDPNDKLVSPNRESSEVLFEEDFIYTIRFQNTGNDVAYDIVILDTLDSNLDLSSFKVLSSSHSDFLLTSLENERYLTFNFKDIFLPDSTTNLEGSQGYVSYMITPIDGLAEKTEIKNTASIYFDSNPPIVTNTTLSILTSELTNTNEIANPSLLLFPNPTSGKVIIRSSLKLEGRLQLSDYTGKIILEQNIRDNQELDISSLNNGVYFINVQTREETIVGKVLKF